MTETSMTPRISASIASAPIRRRAPASRRRPSEDDQSTACARSDGTRRGVAASGGSRSSARSEPPARGPTDRNRGTSGVERRTESGARGGEGRVMSGVSSSMGVPNSGSSDADARVVNDGPGVDAGRGSAARPNSASNPDVARRAVPASINARSSRPSTVSASRRMGKSGSAKAEASAKSYPQLRQRSAVSNPTYPHLEHFTGGARLPDAGARAADRREADRRQASAG